MINALSLENDSLNFSNREPNPITWKIKIGIIIAAIKADGKIYLKQGPIPIETSVIKNIVGREKIKVLLNESLRLENIYHATTPKNTIHEVIKSTLYPVLRK